MSIFITGDTHGDFTRFKKRIFYEQAELSKAGWAVDYIITHPYSFGSLVILHLGDGDFLFLKKENRQVPVETCRFLLCFVDKKDATPYLLRCKDFGHVASANRGKS